jgi:hypothetical protein
MCKPFKMKWANRWKIKELQQLKDFERDIKKDYK